MLEGEMCGLSLHSTNPTKSAPGSLLLCLYFTSFFAPMHFPSFSQPKSPILHHFLRHVSRLSSSGRRVYLPTGKLTRGSANIAPATTGSCPEGGTKCQTAPDLVIADYTLAHPTILLGHSQKIWGLRGRARELSGDIFYAKDVPRQRALCHPPPTFRAPWVFPKFSRAKNLCISPRFTKLCIVCVTNGDNEVKKQCISPNFTSLPCVDPLPPFRPSN